MTEIKIDSGELHQCIQELQTLSNTCSDRDMAARNQQGGGVVIGTVNTLDQKYATVNTALKTLIDNSIKYFQRVEDTFKGTDSDIAKSMAGGGKSQSTPSEK